MQHRIISYQQMRDRIIFLEDKISTLNQKLKRLEEIVSGLQDTKVVRIGQSWNSEVYQSQR